MKENIFKLNSKQLRDCAVALQNKVIKGLEQADTEVLCLPTYITPNKEITNDKVLVLDLGGTNYRAAIVEFINGEPILQPKDGLSKNLAKEMKRENPVYTEKELFKEIADLISGLDIKGVSSIGYCFSYPADPLPNGDAKLIRWTKGVNIPEMVGKAVGEPLLKYLNNDNTLKKKGADFKTIKVINDTVASLFSGLTDQKSKAHIGLIVGTGTNMATFIRTEKIKKIDGKFKKKGLELPINLESGNFHPSYLTIVDEKVDKGSDNKGAQRFEKAVSGMYLGEILKYVFSCDEFETDFDARRLTTIMNYPGMHKDKYVRIARQIYQRSAKLVASSLAGLIVELVSQKGEINDVRLTAEGSLFWSEDKMDKDYKDLVLDKLYALLEKFDIRNIKIHLDKKDNANLIGSAIAGLSLSFEEPSKPRTSKNK